MNRDADGFKRGTNYCHRMAMANCDSRAELAAALTQDGKCAAGEHDERVVPPRYSVWSWRDKRHRETGERYCARCGLTIA